MVNKTLMLIVLDGWGVNTEVKENAVKLAKTPFLNHLYKKYPHTTLLTSGLSVGLPEGQMGNSEVGHLNLGAGRIVYQELTRISKDIEEGRFFKNKVLLDAMNKADGAALHLIGLLSDGGVHSHQEHLFALIKMAKDNGVKKIFIHTILDGRDTPPASGFDYINLLNDKMTEIGAGKIATVTGRFYAMDRDKRWERVEKAFSAMTLGEGNKFSNPMEAVRASYKAKETDEFVKPCVITDGNGNPVGTVNDGDSIIFFNFRADRAREITRAFTECDFSGFRRVKSPSLSYYACMTEYDKKFNLPTVYPPEEFTKILGEVLQEKGMTQLRIAETEKYAHVTFFFNGGVEKPFDGEDRILMPSPKDVPTYDLKPQMSAFEVTNALLKAMEEKNYDFVLLNFANADMVGHTGILEAAIKAIETLDTCLEKIITEILKKGGTALITADHGNAEQMRDKETGEPHTAHTSFPVPLILVDDSRLNASLKSGILADVAPTILKLMNLPIPVQMTGKPLL